MNIKKFGREVYKDRSLLMSNPSHRNSERCWFRFTNGYGADVRSKTHEKGVWTVKVLRFRGDTPEYAFDTGITNDGLVHYNDTEVEEILGRIERLEVHNDSRYT